MQRFKFVSLLFALIGFSWRIPIAKAQPILPAADGTGTIVQQEGNRFDISGGQLSGDRLNLFQSFTQLGLDSNQIANFLATPELQNILARVVGGDPSIINGLLQVTGGNANLFLMNPAGVVFGPTASLNVPAAFTATTATGIGFENGWFQAIGPADFANLLGNPDRLAFSTTPGAIVNAGNLSVSQGNSLSLLGETILSTGTLSASGGQITVTTLPRSSLIRLSQPHSPLSLDLPDASSQFPTPRSLAQLLTGGDAIGSATGIRLNSQGQVELRGSGLTIGAGDVSVRNLSAGAATLSATHNITLSESQLRTTGDLTLLANNTVRIRDTQANPFLAISGGNLLIQGNQTIDILALNHLQITPFQSGGRLSLVSDGVISGDAHFFSKGGFSVLDRAGNPGQFVSLYDPIISVNGDVVFGDYTGAALKVEATGSIRTGNLTITTPDLNLLAYCNTSGNSCSSDAFILASEPAVILRAGVSFLEESIYSYPFTTPPYPDFYELDPSSLSSAIVQGTNFTAAVDTLPATITTGTLTTSARGGTAAGSVILTAPGDINVLGAIVAQTIDPATATPGGVLLTAGGNIRVTGTIDSSALNGGVAGNVTMTANGDVTTGNILAQSIGGTGITNQGGDVSIQAPTPTDIVVGDIKTSAFSRDADSIAGDVALDTAGIVDVGAIDTSGGVDSAVSDFVAAALGGNINLSAGTDLTVRGTVDTSTVNVTGLSLSGDVFLNAGQTVTTQDINTSAETIVGLALAGDVSVSAINRLTVGDVNVAAGNLAGQAIAGDVTLDASTGTTGSIDISAFSLSGEELPGSVIDINSSITTGLIITTSMLVDGSDSGLLEELLDPEFQPQLTTDAFEGEEESDSVDEVAEEEVELAADFSETTTGDLEVDETDQELAADFQEYLEISPTTSLEQSLSPQTTLRQITQLTGIRPAIVYAYFVPTSVRSNKQLLELDSDQLELIIITADREVRKRVPGATRGAVMAAAQQFRTQASDPSNDNYLPSAQQLYQWLVAPMETELKADQINNIAFIADTGLRSLPLAALHDGKNFLLERYSLGLMPTLRLTDTRYVDVRNTQILGMGASEFSDQSPLPAVPQELSVIVRDIWDRGGKYFLNRDFTIENLQRVRQQQRFGILHLATHGEFRPGAPGNSYIQFSNGRLYLNQLRQLQLNDPPIELLVLSACRTALGDRQAELGFAGLAVQAGVKSAMGSLWYVSDAATLGLMTEFYRSLETAPAKAEALRQAQLAMLRGQIRIEGGQLRGTRGGIPLPPALGNLEGSNLTHPYYWAGFTLIGNPW
ncbi:MAG: CHAT domain-containing protein [Leptolyngbyaceae cyanobacterium bins.59]|nr:CHAT domain-containing protein [Leptolyngbyaceae cyanobacterium bins.59]